MTNKEALDVLEETIGNIACELAFIHDINSSVYPKELEERRQKIMKYLYKEIAVYFEFMIQDQYHVRNDNDYWKET